MKLQYLFLFITLYGCIALSGVSGQDSTDPPETDPPETPPPETDPPVTDPPVTDPPVTDPPVTDPPVTDPPETPSPETPSTGSPSPVTDPPETPSTGTPSPDTSATDTPQVPTDPNAEASEEGGASVTGIIIAVVMAIGLLCLGGIAWYCIRRNSLDDTEDEFPSAPVPRYGNTSRGLSNPYRRHQKTGIPTDFSPGRGYPATSVPQYHSGNEPQVPSYHDETQVPSYHNEPRRSQGHEYILNSGSYPSPERVVHDGAYPSPVNNSNDRHALEDELDYLSSPERDSYSTEKDGSFIEENNTPNEWTKALTIKNKEGESIDFIDVDRSSYEL